MQSTDEFRKVPPVDSAGDARPPLGGSARLVPPQYRWAALGLVAVGLLAAGGGVVFSGAREVLFSLAATGLFGGVLATVLGFDRLVPDTVAEVVYDSTAKNGLAFVEALGLSERRIYVPTDERVVLYVPANETQPIPADPTAPSSTDEEPNLVLEPTGSGLFREVHRTRSDDLEPGLEVTARALTERLVEDLEIASEAVPTVDPVGGTVTVGVSGNSFGDVDRFDHPIASYLAVGFAWELDRPVTLEVRPTDGNADWLVTCSWNPDE